MSVTAVATPTHAKEVTMTTPPVDKTDKKKQAPQCALVDIEVNINQFEYNPKDKTWSVLVRSHAKAQGTVRLREERPEILKYLEKWLEVKNNQVRGEKADKIEKVVKKKVPELFRGLAKVRVDWAKVDRRSFMTFVLQDPEEGAEQTQLLVATKVKTDKTCDFSLKQARGVFIDSRPPHKEVTEEQAGQEKKEVYHHALVTLTSNHRPLTIYQKLRKPDSSKMTLRTIHLASQRTVKKQVVTIDSEETLEGPAVDDLWTDTSDDDGN